MQLPPGLVAVVTGAGSGIGAALASSTWPAAVCGWRCPTGTSTSVEKVAARCAELGVDARAYSVDVADADAVAAHAAAGGRRLRRCEPGGQQRRRGPDRCGQPT